MKSLLWPDISFTSQSSVGSQNAADTRNLVTSCSQFLHFWCCVKSHLSKHDANTVNTKVPSQEPCINHFCCQEYHFNPLHFYRDARLASPLKKEIISQFKHLIKVKWRVICINNSFSEKTSIKSWKLKKELKRLICQDASLVISPWDAASCIQGCLKKWYGSRNIKYHSNCTGKTYTV